MHAIELITHYFEDDAEFLGDYASVEVRLDGGLLARYGDASHERGRERAEGAVDALLAVFGATNVQVVRSRVADFS